MMKIKVLIAFLALSLVACSPEETRNYNPPNDDPSNENTNGDLMNNIVHTDFNENGSVKSTTRTEFDDKNRALQVFEYDGEGTLAATTEYTYNVGGQLETMNYFTAATGDLPYSGYTITYDEGGRINGLSENSPSVSAASTFTYNPDNTITAAKTTNSDTLEVTKYFLNSSGLVYKKTNLNSTEEIVYSGENIHTYTTADVVSTFSYDTEHELKGQQQAVASNQFKGNLVNTLIVKGLNSIAMGRTNYVLQKLDSNGDRFDYTYQFNDNGYPVKVRCFKNGSSIPFSIREVSYK